MLLYAQHITPRLVYIINFIGKEFFQEPIEFTTDKEYFKGYNHPKINYSTTAISDPEFWIYPVDLLFETGISKKEIICFKGQDYKAFFKTANGDFSFDVFAGAFYLLSRYEEYLPHEKDSYGR